MAWVGSSVAFLSLGRDNIRFEPLKRGDGYASDHWSRSIYRYRSYRRAGNRPRLSLLSARSGLGLSRQLSIHLPLAMRSHSFWDFFVLWDEPPFCIWMAAAFCKWIAAATAAWISRVVSRPALHDSRKAGWCGFRLAALDLLSDQFGDPPAALAQFDHVFIREKDDGTRCTDIGAASEGSRGASIRRWYGCDGRPSGPAQRRH